MMHVHIKPVDGMLVRDPITATPLRADGELKPLDAYWSRRIADGSVLEVVPSKPVAEKNKPKD